MSYHETCEFFALDRCLTAAQMRALRRISTRATITPNRFYNWYDWEGLKGDPHDMLRRYFDVFVHTGNGVPDCGMLRFPLRAVTLASWRPYVVVQRGKTAHSCAASVVAQGTVAVLAMTPAQGPSLATGEDDEFDGSEASLRDDESVDPASWPVPLALMRERLLAGDLSPLYLLWLLSVQYGDRRATAAEPARPPGLNRLDGALHLFAEFLGLNARLLKAALDDPGAAPRTAGTLMRAASGGANAARRGRRALGTDP